MSNNYLGGSSGRGSGKSDFSYSGSKRVTSNSGREPIKNYSRPSGSGSGRPSGSSVSRPSGSNGGSKKRKEKRLPIGMLIVIDVLLAAMLLGVFYITNYEMQGETDAIETLPQPSWLASASSDVTEPDVSVSPSDSAGPTVSSTTPATTESASPTAVDPNNWRAKFPDKFTDGKVEKTDNSYKSANINISIKEDNRDGVPYFIADIYVAELKYFRTAFAKDADKMGDRELTDKVADENHAILAINGDHCVDNPGLIIRNGKLYLNKSTSNDSLVMNYDGSLQAYSPDDFKPGDIKKTGAYQVWGFGPMLLKDGKAMKNFNSGVTGVNPRTAIGYYEPGHYCFVVIGGRQKSGDQGCTMKQLSQLFEDMGCKAAYNMDGGRSSEMIFLGKMLNEQSGGRRSTTDILYIGE